MRFQAACDIVLDNQASTNNVDPPQVSIVSLRFIVKLNGDAIFVDMFTLREEFVSHRLARSVIVTKKRTMSVSLRNLYKRSDFAMEGEGCDNSIARQMGCDGIRCPSASRNVESKLRPKLTNLTTQ